MNRRLARETAFSVVFESKFQKEKSMAEIYETAKIARGFEDDSYVIAVTHGVGEHREELDNLIEKHSRGWKKNRISPVALSVMEVAVYEMLYCEDIPSLVSINEALELIKTYDEENARAFVNGVLNAVSGDIGEKHEG